VNPLFVRRAMGPATSLIQTTDSDVLKVSEGCAPQVGQRFHLLLLHTSGGRTLDVASYVHQEFPLHDDIEVSHKVLVTQTAEPGCPGSS
jgi:hypothetical protein